MGKMKKKHTKARRTLPPPTSLPLRLFDPGMTALHRAGLGGLACTLKSIERTHEAGLLAKDEAPAAPWADGRPPWKILNDSVTLDFGQPDQAEDYLRKLFNLAFRIKYGLIDLPGQYELAPSREVRAELQTGLLLTFLQHGRVRTLEKETVTFSFDPEGEGTATIQTQYRACSWYKHQSGFKDLVRKGNLTSRNVEVIGPLNPGAIVRHIAYTGPTKIEGEVRHVLPLYFALVGCLALPVNRGVGVLLVPDVQDLLNFVQVRPWLTPRTSRDCRITSPGDAALQAQIRLRAHQLLDVSDLPGFHAILFRPTPWASQQKSRVLTQYVPVSDRNTLQQFEVALANLPCKAVRHETSKAKGRGKRKEDVKEVEWFWVDSVVRPLVADNLAAGRRWYSGFVDLMYKLDANGKPIRSKLFFERKGLHAMIEEMEWSDPAEAAMVRAVHEALRHRFGQIADENQGNRAARKNRWDGEYDRWRLALVGSKTADQFRKALCDLFSRAGGNRVLREHWEQILPYLGEQRWELGRDLALLALPSYAGQNQGERADEEQDAK